MQGISVDEEDKKKKSEYLTKIDKIFYIYADDPSKKEPEVPVSEDTKAFVKKRREEFQDAFMTRFAGGKFIDLTK